MTSDDARTGSSEPHLLFVGGVAQPWGAEIALLRLLEGLRVRAQLTVILLENGPMVERYRSAGARVIILGMPQEALSTGRQITGGGLRSVGSYLRATYRLYRVIRATRPDVVVGNTLRGSTLAGPASRMARRPFVWMARDRLSADYVSGAPRHLFRLILRLTASGVIANSQATASTLPAHPRTLILHDPLAREFFAETRDAGEGRRNVGMIGRLAEWKGHRLFLHAFAQVFAGTDRQARIVGDPSGSDAVSVAELARYASDLGIGDQVSFVGHVDDVVREYQTMDLFVHASLIPEPFGQVVAEALACGCLVIAPNAGGPAEMIRDGENGLSYKMGSASALAKALARAAALPHESREEMIRSGRSTAQRLDPDGAAERFLGFATGLRSQSTNPSA